MEPTSTAQHPDELLPWLANRTLDGAERLEVEAHVATCERCRSELAYLESLRSGIAEMENVQAPGEFGLNRLLRDIRRQPKHAERRRWLAPALAASLAVVVLQGVMLTQMWMQPTNIAPLGRALPDADVLQIRFDPRATEADIRNALQAVGASLIDGPGALGIYRVRLEPGISGKPMEVAQAITSLEARHGVVVQIITESRRAPAATE
ncbi:MAG: zf-HC2 domain-containing protein [Gammaproteobacteria bacterium]|nr:zf-HC2 domain-containing protein [Gammaproteobacteria bacterium]MBU1481290.1 zf-HC2 domain-containing protein [Gammaproteobacteria bacterium]